MKRFSLMLVLLSLAIFFVSCSDDDDDDANGNTQMSIVETAQANSELSILVQAIVRADLLDEFNSVNNVAVLAPTNTAFNALFASNDDWNTIDDVPVDVLRSVLLFHVVESNNFRAAELQDAYYNTLCPGPNSSFVSLQVSITGGVKFNGPNGASPINVDIEATNGIIHTIDKVILPPSIVELALNNPNFSILATAIASQPDILSALNMPGPYTVFAPTDAAFQALLDSNPAWNTLQDIPEATLVAVLSYHVLAGANVQSTQLTSGDITMLSSGTITVDLTSGVNLNTSSGQTVPVAIADIQGTNGVIHVIETVLIP